MASRLRSVTFESADPAVSARFWSRLLDRVIVDGAAGVLVPGDDTQVGLRFVAARTDAAVEDPDYLHLHLTSSSLDDQAQTVAKAVDLGGRHLDVGQRPEDGHIVLADPDAYAFCVIEPDNDYLSDCGYFGEVACDGTRDNGLFWRDALAWPLVWDQDEETAIQAPAGGTKVAWGGPPLDIRSSRNRQRFDLVAADTSAEAARLIGLGATRLDERDGGIELADPDGNEFRLSAG